MKKKSLIMMAGIGSVLGVGAFLVKKHKRRTKAIKELEEFLEEEFDELYDADDSDDELDFGTKVDEEPDYIPKDELMEVFFYLLRLNSDLASDIRENREEITTLYSHLEELAKVNESEE